MENVHEEVHKHLNILRGLRANSGLFLASRSGVSTGYDKAWIRDNFYATLAFLQVGEYETVEKTWRAILDLFLKHREKIDWAAKHRPHESFQYIHARYHPETFEEFWEEWGNKQNDAVGSALFMFATLEEGGHSVITTDEDREMINTLIAYLNSVEYWHDPDNGVWEEYEEIHASSVGAVLAGLKKASKIPWVNIPDGMIEKGDTALDVLLPRESETKFSDLALLSLMYPYALVPREMEDSILRNVEYHLMKSRGVIRYKKDQYYNANAVDGWSEEAEWTMGFPWLSIIYARRGDRDRARKYVALAKDTVTEAGELPELYYSNSPKPNENTPLGWSESLYAVALLEEQKMVSEAPSVENTEKTSYPHMDETW